MKIKTKLVITLSAVTIAACVLADAADDSLVLTKQSPSEGWVGTDNIEKNSEATVTLTTQDTPAVGSLTYSINNGLEGYTFTINVTENKCLLQSAAYTQGATEIHLMGAGNQSYKITVNSTIQDNELTCNVAVNPPVKQTTEIKIKNSIKQTNPFGGILLYLASSPTHNPSTGAGWSGVSDLDKGGSEHVVTFTKDPGSTTINGTLTYGVEVTNYDPTSFNYFPESDYGRFDYDFTVNASNNGCLLSRQDRKGHYGHYSEDQSGFMILTSTFAAPAFYVRVSQEAGYLCVIEVAEYNIMGNTNLNVIPGVLIYNNTTKGSNSSNQKQLMNGAQVFEDCYEQNDKFVCAANAPNRLTSKFTYQNNYWDKGKAAFKVGNDSNKDFIYIRWANPGTQTVRVDTKTGCTISVDDSDFHYLNCNQISKQNG